MPARPRQAARAGAAASKLSAIWNPLQWLIVDADLAWSHARFEDDDPAGNRIPGAVENVASVGVAVDHPSGWFGGARFRHFGPAPLIEDNSVRSQPTTLVNLEAGYRFDRALEAERRALQRLRQQRQRHHLLLRIAARERITAGRRHSFPPGRAANRAADRDLRLRRQAVAVGYPGFSQTCSSSFICRNEFVTSIGAVRSDWRNASPGTISKISSPLRSRNSISGTSRPLVRA